MKPFKKHYVQCRESLSGRYVTELVFINKIKRATTKNNTDKKDGEEGGDWEGPEGGMICACVQTSTSITIKA